MRKMMNKKGFSLVELMIVVVIMGILIAVAIPLYGAITDNANNKTCATNIKTIKQNCANYYSSHDMTTVSSLAQIKAMFDDGKMPVCPVGTGVNPGAYQVKIDTNGSAKVFCPNVKEAVAANSFHEAAKVGSESAALTGALTA